ncbi:MAG: hypothetical protein C4518_16570 [Desulfobacteraceae bacterium]|nr:MAG: hypothetical protein C4518_16570 [Desulfobacteraceae bacterium]
MSHIKLLTVLVITAAVLVFGIGSALSAPAEETYVLLPGAGDKCPIDKDTYFTYGFDKNPQLGIIILKVVVTNNNPLDSELTIIGDSGMPSMPGHHDSGDVTLKRNKKGDYLMPVDVVMPGDWEVRLKFIKENKVIYRGSIRFDI